MEGAQRILSTPGTVPTDVESLGCCGRAEAHRLSLFPGAAACTPAIENEALFVESRTKSRLAFAA